MTTGDTGSAARMSEDHPGLDAPAAADWLTRNVPGTQPPFSFARIAGGRSNLTFRVACGNGRQLVLRRPPVGPHPPSAHDVLREARILRGLADTRVPVPPVLAECADKQVIGAPFVVTAYVEGLVCRYPDDARLRLTDETRRHAGFELVRTLAELHHVNPAVAGLDGHRRDRYLVRQLRRWHEQWLHTRVRTLDAIQRTHRILTDLLPEEQPIAIVHGDYRFDNCILGADGSVAAVLDWEICAAGDPLADVGLLLAYWAEPEDQITVLEEPPTIVPGFPSRAELTHRYLELTGRPPDQPLDYYHAFAWWKVACIVEGVYSRMLAGALGESDRTPESFARQAERLAAHAEGLARRLVPGRRD